MMLMVVGCGENRAISEWKEEKEARAKAATNTNKVDGTTEKPVKVLTAEEEKVVGTYELKIREDTINMVFLANGIVEDYINGKKLEAKWGIVNGYLWKRKIVGITVYRINKDKSITRIRFVANDGHPFPIPKDKQLTFKKIK